ncbi:MAG: DUF4270 family protein, partial [Bacteroidota bacterium]
MKRHTFAWLLATSISAAMLFLSACTSPNDAGKDVLPDEDIIEGHFVDTLDIEFRTLLVDSIITGNLSRNMVGNYLDQQFGWIYAESYMQPRITGTNLSFGNDPSKLTLDSIVLTLDLTDFYGRFNEPIPLEIFEITEAFPDSVMTSRDSLTVDSYDYGNGYSLDFSDFPGFFDFVNIRLDDSLGRKILFADEDSLVNSTVFNEFFKGLMIRSSAVNQANSREPGGVFYFDPRSDLTRLTMYYKDTTAAKTITFDINNNSQRFHRIIRTDYQTRLLQEAIVSNGDLDASYGAVQAGALTKLFVKAHGLSDLAPAGINRAELILKVDPEFLGSQGRFSPPDQLFLFIANEEGTEELDIAQVSSQADYNSLTNSYTIPLTNTLQQILAGRIEDTGFILTPGNGGVTLNRAVIGGPGHPTAAPKMRIIYTSLP